MGDVTLWPDVIEELEELCVAWRALADGEDVEVVDVPVSPAETPPPELEARLRSVLDSFHQLENDLAIALDDARTSLLDLRAASTAADRYLKS